MTSQPVRLLLGTEHLCSYLPQRQARSVFIDPALPLESGLYGGLLGLGFRRSGAHVYRPACRGCHECRPVRVPVAQFAPSRTQKRCLRRNSDLELTVGDSLTAEHHALYRDYLRRRHPGGGMDPDDRAAFHSFLECAWGRPQVWSFRKDGRLVAAGIVDCVPQALSAVYTFFDPAQAARSLGTYAVLRQIAEARAQRLSHLYLGYWVKDSRKMAYKQQFRPLEQFTAEGWRRIEDT